MNFRDEYKKEISELTSDETAERIRRGVAEKLSEPEVAKKKPLPLRRIAVIGGSAAACLVIGVTALALTGGGKHFFAGISNDMMNGTAAPDPTASAGGATNGAPNMSSSGPNYIDINGGDGVADEGQQNTEGIYSGGSGKDAIGDFSPDASIPAGSATEPSASDTARITLDGDTLTLEYNGETAVFVNISDNIDNGYAESAQPEPSNPSTESGERIEVVTSDGEEMFLERRGNEIILFDSEKRLLGIYVTVD